MTMFARDLSVAHYRSFDSYRLALDEGVTILAGPNAAGKTNLIEALQLLTSGASFRHPTAAELVHDGVGSCKVELRLEGDGRVLDMGLSAEDGKRSFSRNGKRCSAAGVRGVLPSVLFCPDHLDMVKRGASVRRAALDDFGMQLSARYADLASTYGRCVTQRNALLKETWCCREMLGAWNDSIARAARPCSCTGWPYSTGWRAMCTLPTGKWRPVRPPTCPMRPRWGICPRSRIAKS